MTARLVLGLVLAATTAGAATFHCDPIHGSPEGDGSRARPWRTVEEVLQARGIQLRDRAGKPANPEAPVKPGHTVLLHSGYSGLGALRHERQARNLFVPAYAGLNLEHILDGTQQERAVLFEPRNAPMELRVIDERTAELCQPPTPHYRVESCQRFQLFENGLIQLTFECIPRSPTWQHGYLHLFRPRDEVRFEVGQVRATPTAGCQPARAPAVDRVQMPRSQHAFLRFARHLGTGNCRGPRATPGRQNDNCAPPPPRFSPAPRSRSGG
ncbi:MAG TPA: hypothetical protein PKM73_05620 [Verrucomicrobiota bacterium]|nr:hypothetical protein [Verrucomicrobiota bacterium]